MKKIIQLIMCVAILPVSAYSQWNISYNGGNFHSSAIAVTNSDTAMLVGNEYGRIYRTDNGGSSWTSYQTEFTSSWFLDLDFVDESVGYAAGGTYFGWHTDILARTMDGGVTWDSITSNSGLFGYTIDHIDFVNIDTGFLAGHSGLQKTFDGGSTFSMVSHNFNIITEVYFYDDDLGYVAERKSLANNYDGYYIWKTTDVGDTWTLVYSDSTDNSSNFNYRGLYRIQMLDDNNGYASGGSSTILKTTDGGNSWTRSSIAPHSSDLTGMWFTDSNTGYVNNAGGIYKTTDGGQNWIVQTVSPVAVVNHIAFANSNDGFAGGQTGIYTTDNGGILTDIESPNKLDLRLFPNPTQNVLNLAFESREDMRITILDMNGRVLIQLENKGKVDVSHLEKGSYLIQLTSKDQSTTKQFIKQ